MTQMNTGATPGSGQPNKKKLTPHRWIIEYESYWNGQMKHIAWLETHNEDCDARLPCDMDWDEQHEGEL
jgi:hypothetical protein